MRRGWSSRMEGRSGRRRAPRRRTGASPAPCRARAARAGGPSASAWRRRGSRSCEGEASARKGRETSRVVGRDEEGASAAQLLQLLGEQLDTLGVEGVERLVHEEELWLVQERAAERQSLQHPARERRRRARSERSRGRSARAASRSARAARARGRAGRTGRGSPSRSARGRRAARVRGNRCRRGLSRPAARPRSAPARPAQSRSSVVFPEPFAPVTTRKPPSSRSRSSFSRTRFSPKRRESPRARITAESPRTNRKKATLITPLTVKNAASSRRRSPGRTSECS